MELEQSGRRPWPIVCGVALLALVAGVWGGFLLGRLSPQWGSDRMDRPVTALPGLDWKKAGAEAGATEWTVHVDFPDAARLAELQSQLANRHQGVVNPALLSQSRFVLAQTTVPKAEQDTFGRKFHEALRENLRLQGLNVSNTVGGGSYQKRPNDRTKDVETRYEGIRYSKWSNDGAGMVTVGEGWITVSFDQDVATVVLSLTEVHHTR
jgi:hypothetical protein